MIDDGGVTSEIVKIPDILHDHDTSNTFWFIDGRAANDEFYLDDRNFPSENSEYSVFMSNVFDGQDSSLKIGNCRFSKASKLTIKWKNASKFARNKTSRTSYAETVGKDINIINAIFSTTIMYGYYTDNHANNYLFYCDNNQLFVDIDFINHTWSNLAFDTFMTSLTPRTLQFLSITVEDTENYLNSTDSQLIRFENMIFNPFTIVLTLERTNDLSATLIQEIVTTIEIAMIIMMMIIHLIQKVKLNLHQHQNSHQIQKMIKNTKINMIQKVHQNQL